MTMNSELWNIARNVAEQAQLRVASLEREILELEERIAEKKAERAAARHAPQRLMDYQVKLGADYQCPSCWIEHETRSPLHPIAGTKDEDFFRCGSCGGRFSIPFF